MTPENLLDALLTQRGFITAEERNRFMNPQYAGLYDPYLMHDVDRAVLRIVDALEHDERICIYSDYDADGIPGAVILDDFFKSIGYDHVWNYIPHRHTEGYGLHKAALDAIKEKGTRLVITVDLGITAVEEVAYANACGLDVVVTDHHEPLEKIPDACAVVNPKLGTYPDRMLCGAGVAFKLVQALIQNEKIQTRIAEKQLPDGFEKWLLDMVGIATLSDMVPLTHENRILAYFGMKVLEKTRRPGLQALFQKSGIVLQHLIEDDIVFSITPRLNAASRMAHPDDAFKLLAAKNRKEGMVAAEHLSSLNDDRKKTVAHIMKDVHARITQRQQSGTLPNILVIGDPTWPAGILGLVASKIIETYNVTAFVWGSEGDSVKGSCRGVGDVAVVQLMEKTADKLTHFGGHEDAGGFATTKDHVHFLESLWNEYYQSLKKEKPAKKTTHDLVLPIECVTMQHYKSLRQLAPFGMSNQKPVFAFTPMKVVDVRQFGKTKEHLEIVFEGTKIRAISWYASPTSFTEPIEPGKEITLLAEFDYSVFRGKEELRLRIKDVL